MLNIGEVSPNAGRIRGSFGDRAFQSGLGLEGLCGLIGVFMYVCIRVVLLVHVHIEVRGQSAKAVLAYHLGLRVELGLPGLVANTFTC